MFRYGRMTQHAVAATKRLAELYGDDGRRASSSEIAHDCGLSQALVAKILNTLASEGLIVGAPGPGGGYRLASPPDQLSLFMVVRLFEHGLESSKCPFGQALCVEKPCTAHDNLVGLTGQVEAYLKNTTFGLLAGLGAGASTKRSRGRRKVAAKRQAKPRQGAYIAGLSPALSVTALPSPHDGGKAEGEKTRPRFDTSLLNRGNR